MALTKTTSHKEEKGHALTDQSIVCMCLSDVNEVFLK